jgi:CRISPR-associated endonuclease/helicase Cas3
MSRYVSGYWGKAGDGQSWHPVAYHSLDVAACLAELFRRRPHLVSLMARMLKVPADEVIPLAVWLVALHDIGKYSPRFQAKRPDIAAAITGQAVTGQTGYAHADGSMAVWESYGREFLAAIRQGVTPIVAGSMTTLFRAVAGHHGRPVQPSSMAAGQLNQVRADIFAFVEEVTRIIGPHLPDIEPEAARKASWLLSGITVVADWIGSNSEWFAYASESGTLGKSLEEYWSDVAVPRARSALEKAGLTGAPRRDQVALIRDLFASITNPTPLQAALTDLDLSGGPGLCLVEDLTGSGKTEAALLLARRMVGHGLADGVYVALPTSATSNGMYARLAVGRDGQEPVYRKFFEPVPEPSLVLAHSMRTLNTTFNDSVLWSGANPAEAYAGEEETASATCSAWIADMSRKSLLADVGVGTIDQALLAVLPNKYQSIRLAGLAGKVIILDEVHCYDSYMIAEISGLLRFLAMLRCPVVALSATLPVTLRQKFLDAYREGAGWAGSAPIQCHDYPLVTWLGERPSASDAMIFEQPVGFREGSGSAYPVLIKADPEAVMAHLVRAAESGCACWIRNTVDDVREAVAWLTARAPHLEVMLFHSRYCAGDRQVIEDKVLELFGKDSVPDMRTGRILVATQVVEQSLDLDFDAMVSDLAPIDSLIQRAGRLHRHDRGTRSSEKILLIHSPEPTASVGPGWYSDFFPKAAFVYPLHTELWLTAHILCHLGCLDLRKDSRLLIESVYGEKAGNDAPATLIDRDAPYRSSDAMAGTMGAQAMLNHLSGYDRTAGLWDLDIRTPTRLAEPDVPVRLAVMTSDGIKPWSTEGQGHQQWIHSTLNLPGRWIDEVEISSPQHVGIDCVRKKWPKFERDIPIVVAKTRGAIEITGNREGRPVVIDYSASLGAERRTKT